MRLLLVEDDNGISLALAHALATAYTVDVAKTGAEGLQKTEQYTHDIIVLDLHLPDMSGLAVCQELREHGTTTPILILTADAKIMSKINLLDAGADDYLTKPFSLGELKARLRVLIRHKANSKQAAQWLKTDELSLNISKHQVKRDGQLIKLRRKEFAMLECLMYHAGSVVSRDALTTYAWRETDETWTNTVDVHIKHLRDKIDRPFDRPLIKTVHGLGYKLETSGLAAKTCRKEVSHERATEKSVK
jgi:two-component system, OmpR family, response regulator